MIPRPSSPDHCWSWNSFSFVLKLNKTGQQSKCFHSRKWSQMHRCTAEGEHGGNVGLAPEQAWVSWSFACSGSVCCWMLRMLAAHSQLNYIKQLFNKLAKSETFVEIIKIKWGPTNTGTKGGKDKELEEGNSQHINRWSLYWWTLNRHQRCCRHIWTGRKLHK